MGFPTLIYFSNGNMFEYPEINRDLYNMTQFVMEGYLDYKGEEIPNEPDRIKNFKKHVRLFFEKIKEVGVIYPVYLAIFLVGFVLIFYLGMKCVDYIFEKIEGIIKKRR